MKKILAMLLTVGALVVGATTADVSLAQATPAADAKKDAKKDDAKMAPADAKAAPAADAKKEEAPAAMEA